MSSEEKVIFELDVTTQIPSPSQSVCVATQKSSSQSVPQFPNLESQDGSKSTWCIQVKAENSFSYQVVFGLVYANKIPRLLPEMLHPTQK